MFNWKSRFILVSKVYVPLIGFVLGITNGIFINFTSPHLFWSSFDRFAFILSSVLIYGIFGALMSFFIALAPISKLVGLKEEEVDKNVSFYLGGLMALLIVIFIMFKFIQFSLFFDHLLRNCLIIISALAGMILVWRFFYYVFEKTDIGERVHRSIRIFWKKSVAGIVLMAMVVLIGINLIYNKFIDKPKFLDSEAPNIILISLDTLGARHMSCYGYFRSTTPNIDKFANEGVLFENASSQAKWTLPSHMSIFTSVVPTVHQVNDADKILDTSFVTLAEILSNEGYYCGAFVDGLRTSWIGNIHGYSQGFSFYEHYYEQFDKYWKLFIISHLKNFLNDRLIRMGCFKYLNAERISKSVAGWLKHFDREKPFFLFVHYYDIHADSYTQDPYISPAPYNSIFVSDYQPDFDKINPKRLCGALLLKYLSKSVRKAKKRDKILSKSDLEYFVAKYDGGIRYVDQWVGYLLKEIENLKIKNNTVVVIAADHGEEFFEHTSFLHGQLFEEIIHVPLIIRYPNKLPFNKRIKSLVRLIDIAPTLIDLAGGKPIDQFQGVSLLPYIFEEKGHNSLICFGGQDKPWDVSNYVKKNFVKLISNSDWRASKYQKESKLELYLLKNDPNELVNYVEDMNDIVEKLKAVRDEWIQKSINLRKVIKKGKTQRIKVDKKTIDQLKALGYIKG